MTGVQTCALPISLVLGRHLIALGYRPNAQFTPLLNQCFEAQLDGIFTDEAGGIAFLKSHLETKTPER